MLHRRFDIQSIYQGFAHEDFQDFDEWKKKAAAASEVLVSWQAAHTVRIKGETLPVDAKIYGALKKCLKDYFFGKCAYCESVFDHVAWGDVEHYRPKRGVTEDKEHPGYYWLAYCTNNLMPTCQLCNQGKGKRNHFPITGKRAMKPVDDVSQELPELLSPYEENDCGPGAAHVKYVFEESERELMPTGRIEGITIRGEKSVYLYDLNRAALVKQRRKNQESVIAALSLARGLPELEIVLKKWLHPEEEHATAVRAACQEWLAFRKRQLAKAQVILTELDQN